MYIYINHVKLCTSCFRGVYRSNTASDVEVFVILAYCYYYYYYYYYYY